MPYVEPSRSDVHVNRPLTGISVAFLQSQDTFVASRVFPNVPVMKQSDRYFTYKREDFNRDRMRKRAAGAASERASYGVDNTPSYFADVWALHDLIPDVIRANADDPLTLDRATTLFLSQQAAISREVQWATNFFDTLKWSTEWAGVASDPSTNEFLLWSDAASTPVEDVRAVKTAVQLKTGYRPNQFICNQQVYDILVDHPDIVGRLDRGQTDGPAKANRDSLAAIFEVDRVNVMGAIKNTADKGQTESNTFIGGKHALLTYSPVAPGLMVPSAGYTMSWQGYLAAGPEGNRISSWYDRDTKSEKVEIEMAYDMKQVSAELGGFFYGAVT